jgi:hypothetical protein
MMITERESVSITEVSSIAVASACAACIHGLGAQPAVPRTAARTNNARVLPVKLVVTVCDVFIIHPESKTPGSVGPGTDPSRVIKGKKMPGQMGNTRTTIRNLQVVRVDGERNLLFVKGGIPGSRNGYVLISK